MRITLKVAGKLANVSVAIYEVADNPNKNLWIVFGFFMRSVRLKLSKEAA
jgi:hypothetical protein